MATMLHRCTLVAMVYFAMTAPSAAWEVYIVYFDRESTTLSHDAKLVIRDVRAVILDSPIERLEKAVVYGHADFAEAAPDALSLKRAEAVRQELYRLGLPKSFPIEVRARGTSDPAVPNPSDERRVENRRVIVDLVLDCSDARIADDPMCASALPK